MIFAVESSNFSLQQRLPFLLVLLLLTALFAWACLWVVLRTILAMRRLRHAEHMKIIDAGQSKELLQAIENQHRSRRMFSLALSLAFFVPGLALLGATFATVRHREGFATPLVVWCGAIVVSLASIICATIMIRRHKGKPSSVER